MKRLVLTLCLALALPAAVVFAEEAPAPLDVSALMLNVEQVKGVVFVEGVVAKVYPKEQRFGMIDTEEFKRCGVVTCADMVLPVRWSGAMPEPKNIVRVEGEVQKNAGRLEFVARSVEKAASAEAGK